MRRVLETRFESADSFTCNRQHIPIDFILEDHDNFHKLLAYIEVDTILHILHILHAFLHNVHEIAILDTVPFMDT